MRTPWVSCCPSALHLLLSTLHPPAAPTSRRHLPPCLYRFYRRLLTLLTLPPLRSLRRCRPRPSPRQLSPTGARHRTLQGNREKGKKKEMPVRQAGHGSFSPSSYLALPAKHESDLFCGLALPPMQYARPRSRTLSHTLAHACDGRWRSEDGDNGGWAMDSSSSSPPSLPNHTTASIVESLSSNQPRSSFAPPVHLSFCSCDGPRVV